MSSSLISIAMMFTETATAVSSIQGMEIGLSGVTLDFATSKLIRALFF